MSLPVEIIQAVSEGRCILFLGSRASAEAAQLAGQDYPAAKAMARRLGWKAPRRLVGGRSKHVTPSVEQGAELFQAAKGRGAMLKELQRAWGLGSVAPSAAHRLALRHFPLIFSTCWDDLLPRAAAEAGSALKVQGRLDPVPSIDVGAPVLVAWRGLFTQPDTLLVTPTDHQVALPSDQRKSMRRLIHGNTVLFVGFRPDEEEFEHLWEELTDAYGGELPRCHMAVPQGRMDDFLWQKWVWRGLLLFTADPVECLQDLDARRESTST